MRVTDPKKRILLHSCCGPCSTAVIHRLISDYEVTVFFYNPNITDALEYERRKAEQIRFLKECEAAEQISVDLIEGPYDPEVYYSAVVGLEQEPEGGARCARCFYLRLQETARRAAQGGFDCFDTTLTVSPHKNFDVIYALGAELALTWHVQYLNGNYKKKDGYRQSVEWSRQYGLYRQSYCGCSFSRRES